MKLLPTRITILDHIKGRNEKVYVLIVGFLLVCILSQEPVDSQYPTPGYDENDPQDMAEVQKHATPISDFELDLYKLYLKNAKN